MSEVNPVTEPETNENEETEEETTPVTEPETNENEETEEETTPVPFSTAVTFNLGKFDEGKLVKTEMVDENGYWKTTYGVTAEETEEETEGSGT